MRKQSGRFAANITDFGLSKSNLSKNSENKTGTPAYKSPEYGNADLTEAIDLFSFGGVLIFMFGAHHAHPLSDKDHTEIERM